MLKLSASGHSPKNRNLSLFIYFFPGGKILWLQFGYCKKEEPLRALNDLLALTPHS